DRITGTHRVVEANRPVLESAPHQTRRRRGEDIRDVQLGGELPLAARAGAVRCERLIAVADQRPVAAKVTFEPRHVVDERADAPRKAKSSAPSMSILTNCTLRSPRSWTIASSVRIGTRTEPAAASAAHVVGRAFAISPLTSGARSSTPSRSPAATGSTAITSS